MRSQGRCMLPESTVNLDDADDRLCKSEHLTPTSADDSSTPLLDETYSGRQYGMVVPSRNVQ